MPQLMFDLFYFGVDLPPSYSDQNVDTGQFRMIRLTVTHRASVALLHHLRNDQNHEFQSSVFTLSGHSRYTRRQFKCLYQLNKFCCTGMKFV